MLLGLPCGVRSYSRGYGATAARLTPDQKVGSSNLSALILSLAGNEVPRDHVA
jgi:hypothetical protein